MSEKVIFENINLKKSKNLPQKGLKERTFSTTVKKYKEKMKNEGNEYSSFVSPTMFIIL